MGEAVAAWTATAAIWADGMHQGVLGVFRAVILLAVAWHALRVAWGALAGNARRELIGGLWQLALLGLAFKVVENPRPMWGLALGLAGGLYQLIAAPFGG